MTHPSTDVDVSEEDTPHGSHQGRRRRPCKPDRRHMSDFVALGSAVIALTAVLVAIWQIRENARGIRRSNSLPVIATTFNEFRSSEFQDHLRKVWYSAPSSVPEGGFQALEYEWRQSAYIVRTSSRPWACW